jgi:alpha-1,6-mannosyltransferase
VRWSPTWGWAGLGLVGSALAAFTGSRLLGSGAVKWWYTAGFPTGHTAVKLLFWLGIASLCGAWLGLGRSLDGARLPQLWTIGALWCLPFLLGPPLFSHDVYSYLAQGTLVHLGHSPYHDAPVTLARLHHEHVLSAVDPFWRRTTAPYGPLFLGVISLMVGATGSHLVAGAVVIRLLDVIGVVLLAAFVPRLARAVGSDPRRALWLAMLSPLVLLQLVSPAHNDALMAGLMVAGIAVALERRPLMGIALCAIAATVKVPAVAAIAFVVVAWARTLPDNRERLIAVGKAVGVTALISAAVTLVTGLGLAWISTGLFNTPGRVRLSITPATALGYTIAHALHHVSVTLNGKQFEATVSHVTFAITAAIGLILLYRTRFENLVLQLGALLVGIAIGGPAAWPWYFTWGLALLACWPSVQRSQWIPIAVVVPAFIIIPNGQLALTLSLSPYMLLLYLLLLAVAGRRWWSRRGALPRSSSGAASVLAHR